MPIDYSKFDRIDDSDEEAPRLSASASAARAVSGGYPTAASGAKAGSSRSSSGRECLEPAGLEDRFRILEPRLPTAPAPGASSSSPDLIGLERELERWASAHESSTPGTTVDDSAHAGALATTAPAAATPGEPQRLCVKEGGRKKIHTTYHDGSEMVEEFDARTDILLMRRSRRPTALGGGGEWVVEVGQTPEAPFDPHSDMLRSSASNPIFLRKDTPDSFQWRIRNLPYPADVYSVVVDHDKQEVVVRTSNKKYYKRIGIPDLGRLGIKLTDQLLTWKHQHNTLIISYSKPAEVIDEEQKSLRQAEQAAIKL